jgi:hypothetical protein
VGSGDFGMKLIFATIALLTAVASGAALAQTSPYSGGTGIRNLNSSTLTLGGPLSITGPFSAAITLTAPTSIIWPTSGTLATTAQITGGTLAGSFTTLSAAGAVTSTASGNAFISNSTADQTGYVLQNAGVTKWTLYNRSGFADNFQILSATTGTGFTVLQASGRGSFGSGADVVGSLTATSFNDDAGNLIISSSNPVIASGFGTGPTCSPCNNTAAFKVTVGTGGLDSTGVITMPTASGGWACHVLNLTDTSTAHMLRMTAMSTTSLTVTNSIIGGGNQPFGVANVLLFQCAAF